MVLLNGIIILYENKLVDWCAAGGLPTATPIPTWSQRCAYSSR